MKLNFKFKYDSYTKKRGRPACLIISCSNCKNYIMHYQKDGPGPLLRCYLDRIHYPEELESLQYKYFDKESLKQLICISCNIIIGLPIVYEKENRLAYHMVIGSFKKKIYKQ